MFHVPESRVVGFYFRVRDSRSAPAVTTPRCARPASHAFWWSGAPPGGQIAIPPGYDGVAAYESQRGPVRRVAAHMAEWDLLLGQPQLQLQRDLAVFKLMGDKAAMWDDIVVGRYDGFVACYTLYVTLSGPPHA